MTFEILQMDAEKRGRAEGETIGEAKGVVKTLATLVKDGLLDVKEACRRANMTEQEFRRLLTVK